MNEGQICPRCGEPYEEYHVACWDQTTASWDLSVRVSRAYYLNVNGVYLGDKD